MRKLSESKHVLCNAGEGCAPGQRGCCRPGWASHTASLCQRWPQPGARWPHPGPVVPAWPSPSRT